ncbi:hypothetical protein JIG36_10865 [Actinoplanes sp. LDG1-06]|uniref:Uncharacterized protein n=1 Tax=Paractinoplanes ovalisporus TaxID=2810368 RepID=A0ABS2A9X8_9ACTN|nr:hypothetical protein [Actinoplanes ovalisporus]MBM2616056.1 hypothetical protein [Actinoplanes ovalisporus]
MSDAEFLGYAGSLAAGGLLFLILAVFGLGQGIILRVTDVLLGLAFLGYAGYLMVVAPESPFMSWLVFITPAAGLAVALTARRRARRKIKRLEEEHSAKPYAGQEAAVNAERLPYPSPPPPLDPSSPAPQKQAKPAGKAEGLPSGLPSSPPPSGLGAHPLEASPRPARPSGLPQPHAEPRPSPSPSPHADPGYRARHGVQNDETAHHDYSGGRHRADGES